MPSTHLGTPETYLNPQRAEGFAQRGFLDYGTMMIGDWGIHQFGPANWALGLGFMGTLLVTVLYAWRGDQFDLNFSPLAIAHISASLAIFGSSFGAI